MGIPYLNSDESIILSTHNILVDAEVSEAILTNRRLLIVNTNSTLSRHREISFAAIETVTIMESGSGDPALSLAVLKKSGGTNPMHLVFTQHPRSPRIGERDEWAQRIKEQIALLPAGTIPEYVDFEDDEGEDLKKLIGYKEGEAVMDKKPSPAARPKNKTTSGLLSPASASGKNMLIATTAIVVVILLVAGAAFIYPAFMSPKNTLIVTPEPTLAPTAAATIMPVTTATLIPQATIVPAVTPEQTPALPPAVITPSLLLTNIPAYGVWVRIGYDGNYTGTIGSGGRLREVSGTGGRYYQVPATSTEIIEIAIQKLDTTGLPLTVEVFKNGDMIKRKMIITPKGTLVMTVDLKMAQTPIITPAVTP
jgi:hypothetical protein